MSLTAQRERIPLTPPVIAPIPVGENRPLWSVMIPVYNTISFLELCLQSVLEQDRGTEQMQIMVVDDASTDGDVEALVKRIGEGRIGYFRQPYNMGKLRNFETCIKLARGQYIHLLYGDHYLVKDFYVEIENLFEDFPRIAAAFTEYEHINESNKKIWEHPRLQVLRGVLKDSLITVARKQVIQPPSLVVKRTVYENIGAYYAAEYGTFWEFCARIAAYYEIAYCPRTLSKYRVHEKTISLSVAQSRTNIKDIARVIGIIRSYLPFEIGDAISKNSRKHFSKYYVRLSHKVYHEFNQPWAAVMQAWQALMMNVNVITLKYSFLLFFKVLIGYRYFRKLVEKLS